MIRIPNCTLIHVSLLEKPENCIVARQQALPAIRKSDTGEF